MREGAILRGLYPAATRRPTRSSELLGAAPVRSPTWPTAAGRPADRASRRMGRDPQPLRLIDAPRELAASALLQPVDELVLATWGRPAPERADDGCWRRPCVQFSSSGSLRPPLLPPDPTAPRRRPRPREGLAAHRQGAPLRAAAAGLWDWDIRPAAAFYWSGLDCIGSFLGFKNRGRRVHVLRRRQPAMIHPEDFRLLRARRRASPASRASVVDHEFPH